MPITTHDTLDYAAPTQKLRPRRLRLRTVVWVIAIPLILLLLNIPLAFLANGYTSSRFPGVKVGMTRAEVDRHLYAFTTQTNASYTSLAPGETAVQYEFLWFGKLTAIKVIYDASGTVAGTIPSFDN